MKCGCLSEIDIQRLQERVRETYERVARAPGSAFHFHTGADYAVRILGYSRAELDELPAECRDGFAGVGNPFRIGPIAPGAVVLDHACGSGVDLLLAARRVGPTGRAIGVDLTPAMRELAARAAAEAGLGTIVDVREGTFEDLPVESDSVDYVISNGVLNLAPNKARVLEEIARVLKPGGELYLADVVLSRELAPVARRDPDLWAACIGGALLAHELAELATEAGLVGGRITERFDSYRGTRLERKLGTSLHVDGVNFAATKPGAPARAAQEGSLPCSDPTEGER